MTNYESYQSERREQRDEVIEDKLSRLNSQIDFYFAVFLTDIIYNHLSQFGLSLIEETRVNGLREKLIINNLDQTQITTSPNHNKYKLQILAMIEQNSQLKVSLYSIVNKLQNLQHILNQLTKILYFSGYKLKKLDEYLDTFREFYIDRLVRPIQNGKITNFSFNDINGFLGTISKKFNGLMSQLEDDLQMSSEDRLTLRNNDRTLN